MAKKKLTEKLKAEIRANYTRIKKSDLSDNAAAYLKRVRAGHKAAKTRKLKVEYKSKKTFKKGPSDQAVDLIGDAAKAKGLTLKQFEKKYKADVEKFKERMILPYNREIDNLKLDIRFFDETKKVKNRGKKISRSQAIYLLSRLKNAMQSTGLVYDKINVRFHYDGRGNMELNLPEPNEYADLQGNKLLLFTQQNYPLSHYLKK